MISYQYIPHITTTLFILLLSVLIVYLFTIRSKQKQDEENFEKQLRHNIDPLEKHEEKESKLENFTKKLPELMIKAEMAEKTTPVEELSKKLILLFGILTLGGTFFAGSPLAGLTLVFFMYIGLYGIATYKVSKVRNLMDEQIPGFISTFKANIQANQHSQNAMIRAINNTASPLYDELAYAKAIMEAGDFRPGIIALRQNTENDTLRQMASCIELASSTGSNIEEQIEIIEEIIADKQEIEREKRLGINENKPLFIIAALFVPLSFIGSYAMSEMHRDFWFKSTLSWIILIGVLVTTVIASFFTWKIIQKVDIV